MTSSWWKSCAVVTVFAVISSGCATTEDPSETSERAWPITSHYTSSPPRIDGDLSDSAWASACRTVLRYNLADDTGTADYGHARFLHDDVHLYVAISVRDKDLFGITTERDGHVYREDTVELFVKPNPQSRVYFEFEFSTSGQVFDARWPSRNMVYAGDQYFASWNSAMRWGVKLNGTLNQWQDEDEGWQVEVAIPWSDFADAGVTSPPTTAGDDDAWRIAICRYDFSSYLEHPQLTSTAPLSMSQGFHEYEKYNVLKFVRRRY